MNNASSTIISQGNTYHIYSSTVQAHADLPVATYRVNFHPMAGYSLERSFDLTSGEEKVYGSHNTRIDRVLKTYGRLDRSLGVLLSGDKGMGKSLMVRLLSERVIAELNIPVIVVEHNTPGLPQFLDTLGEVMVIFDEFEKVFPKREDDENVNSQNQFLGLFDGVSSTKRIYAITVNNLFDLSDYFVNRPGRFHYHIRFDYPSPEEVQEYLADKAPNTSKDNIDKAVSMSLKTNLNYDHLRALAFELEGGGDFDEIIGDLNIKRVDIAQYDVRVEFKDGFTLHGTQRLDLFSARGLVKVNLCEFADDTLWDITFQFNPSDVAISADGLTVDPSKINVIDKSGNLKKIKAVSLNMLGQHSIDY